MPESESAEGAESAESAEGAESAESAETRRPNASAAALHLALTLVLVGASAAIVSSSVPHLPRAPASAATAIVLPLVDALLVLALSAWLRQRRSRASLRGEVPRGWTVRVGVAFVVLSLVVAPLVTLLALPPVMTAIDRPLPEALRLHLVEYEASLGMAHRFCLEREPDPLCARDDVRACIDGGETDPRWAVGRRSTLGLVRRVAHNPFFGDVAVLEDATGRRLLALDELCVEGEVSEAWRRREAEERRRHER